MIKNKHISKITMLTCLMLGRIVNAQEFYTCVPKKSWWKDVMTESVEKGVKFSHKKDWDLVAIISNLGDMIEYEEAIGMRRVFSIYNSKLTPGIYKFKLILKDEKGIILNTLSNILNLKQIGKLKAVWRYSTCKRGEKLLQEFLSTFSEYDFEKSVYIQYLFFKNVKNCAKYDAELYAGEPVMFFIGLNNISLFTYEFLNYSYGNNYEHATRIFKKSVLEIYKQNDG